MRYSICIVDRFCASHQLRLPGGALEPLHGHTWNVEVTVSSASLDAIETVMDFHELHRELVRVVGAMNNTHLNDLDPFKSRWNPTAERVAQWIGESLRLPDHVRVDRVSVEEAPGCFAIVEW